LFALFVACQHFRLSAEDKEKKRKQDFGQHGNLDIKSKPASTLTAQLSKTILLAHLG
jgi:hypothetical protein